VCSIDKAEQIGLNWWRYDPRLTAVAATAHLTNGDDLEGRLARLERRLEALAGPSPSVGPVRGPAGPEPPLTE